MIIAQDRLRVVDISDMAVSGQPDDVLVTYSLGSCLGLALYDPAIRLAGMIHCMLPLAKQDCAKAAERPCMFVDRGVAALLTAMFELGARRSSLVAKIAGCGEPLETQMQFRIGERNHMILRKILWKNEILIRGEEIGGKHPRSLYIEADTGRTWVRTAKQWSEI